MVQQSKKIKIAFILPEDQSWTGGVNYLRNLLFSIKAASVDHFRPILYVARSTPDKLLDSFTGLAEIRKSRVFEKRTWIFRKLLILLVGRDFLCVWRLKRDQVDCVSHYLLPGKNLPFKVINWIPDFQHVHLPEMFRCFEIRMRDKWLHDGLKNCDRMILSSYDARKDCINFDPSCVSKTRVLHFVAQCNKQIYAMGAIEDVCAKYKIPGKFFYIPNQFWAHKNHLVVIEALHLLKATGHDIHIVCSGATVDYRNSEYFTIMQEKIKKYGLEGNVHILGMIDYDHVMTMFRHSVSVINPSLFEGWSTSVEEAKSVGKNIILSDIPVHREQNPPEACFFNPEDTESLAKLMTEKWLSSNGGPDYELENVARANLSERTERFGKAYQSILLEVLS